MKYEKEGLAAFVQGSKTRALAVRQHTYSNNIYSITKEVDNVFIVPENKKYLLIVACNKFNDTHLNKLDFTIKKVKVTKEINFL